MRRPLAAAITLVLSVTLSACFTTTADFGTDAETFITENDELRAALLPDPAASFVDATCVEPANRDDGTSFPCTATDSNGETWEFEVVITGTNEYEVNLARSPEGA